jgi:hypothetical protein
MQSVVHVIGGVVLPDDLPAFNHQYLNKSEDSALLGSTDNGATAFGMLASVHLLAGAVALFVQLAVSG